MATEMLLFVHEPRVSTFIPNRSDDTAYQPLDKDELVVDWSGLGVPISGDNFPSDRIRLHVQGTTTSSRNSRISFRFLRLLRRVLQAVAKRDRPRSTGAWLDTRASLLLSRAATATG